jgi:hypothetical protein
MDSERGKFVMHRFGKTFDGELGGAVHAEPGRPAMAPNRRDYSGRARSRLAHIRQQRPAHGQQPEHVGAVHRFYFGSTRFLHCPHQAETSVVEKHIDLAETIDRGRCDRLILIRHVECHVEQIGVFAETFGNGFGIARCRDDTVALG